MKPKLLLHPDKWSNATAFFLQPLFDEYFEIVFIDPLTTYNNKECIVYSHCVDANWVIPWRDRGFVVVVDNLWENPWKNLPSDIHLIKPGRWFLRANESLWYKALGYDQYQRCPNITKTFLMFINRKTPHRDQIWQRIDLDNSIYSYHGRGIELNYADASPSDPGWQREFNPDWYNLTNYSLVVETVLFPEDVWHTEKTWKPIAFYHPFILWGPPGYIKDLQDQGFKTFNHIIDESYDAELDNSKRLDMIINQVNKLKDICLTDVETVNRTIHNRNLFFDTEWSTQQFRQHLFEPILNLL